MWNSGKRETEEECGAETENLELRKSGNGGENGHREHGEAE
jgi:hypothetical protein